MSTFERQSSQRRKKTAEEKEVLRREGSDVPSRLARAGLDKKPQRVPEPVRNLWRRYHLTKWCCLILGILVLFMGTYLFVLAKSAKVADLRQALQAMTIIYDKDGGEAGSLSGQKGTYVELEAMSPHLQDAVIATEDRSFYENSGINYPRFLLATLTMGRSGGGSTITQQLAKNAYLSQEQTVTRKAKEFFLALELTKTYSKDEILAMYLNHAYFGNGIWGVEDASHKYFGRSAAQLTLEQAATLAGMLKGPNLYNPLDHLERSVQRRNTVLQGMVEAEKIDQETADVAMQVDMASQLLDTYQGKADNYNYPSYFDAVIEEAEKRYGLSENELVNNGYRIYTEMDQASQANLQLIYNNDFLFPVAADGTAAQSASVALDPKTGGVRALVGRINSDEAYTYRSFNYATQGRRSPGSTIKPLVDYAPALDQGWQLDDPLDNSQAHYGGNYTVQNYMDIYSGVPSVPMYEAVAQSLNKPAVWLLNELGIETGLRYGGRFGLQLDQVEQALGLALGAGVGTNPLEMAQAYAVFANDGIRHQAHLIARIENASGRTIKQYHPKTVRVVSTSTARQMTSMLLGTFSNGTGIYANPYGYVMAGKTGTTETDFNPNLTSDQWVIGYTPDLVISQWLGFDQTDETHYLEGTSSGAASTIFNTVASHLLPYTAQTPFSVDNAYAVKGIAAVTATSEEEMTLQEQSVLDSIRQESEAYIQAAKDRLAEIELPARAQTLWEYLRSLFQ